VDGCSCLHPYVLLLCPSPLPALPCPLPMPHRNQHLPLCVPLDHHHHFPFAPSIALPGGTRLGPLPLPAVRPKHLYHPASWYSWAAAANFLLRMTWAHRLLGNLEAHDEVLLVVACLEVVRRWQWVFVRVETELRKLSHHEVSQAGDGLEAKALLGRRASFDTGSADSLPLYAAGSSEGSLPELARAAWRELPDSSPLRESGSRKAGVDAAAVVAGSDSPTAAGSRRRGPFAGAWSWRHGWRKGSPPAAATGLAEAGLLASKGEQPGDAEWRRKQLAPDMISFSAANSPTHAGRGVGLGVQHAAFAATLPHLTHQPRRHS
jgi:hypothetical protein